jgi:hypothetical protein
MTRRHSFSSQPWPSRRCLSLPWRTGMEQSPEWWVAQWRAPSLAAP